MRRWTKWLLVFFILYLILGFIAGFLLGEGVSGLCTQKYCFSPYNSCVFNAQADLGCTNESCPCTRETCPQCDSKKQEFAEVPCNSCGMVDSYFYTFIINYGRKCPGLEIMQYNGTKNIGERFEMDKSSTRCYSRFSFILP